MRYQLVLQFSASSIADYDDLITIEDALIKELSRVADVDGHDCGSDEMNVFIFTNAPEEVFEKTKSVLAKCNKLENLTVAFREAGGDKYRTLWPIGSDKPFRIT
ncbi:MAG TPA: ABC transporter [Verrucomicrobiae bacterium]|jgi:hypothetical protein|nr:ABC transporter [Verrucomicrobiae bacterium]